MAMNDVQMVSQAWNLATQMAVQELLQYLRETLQEAENQWNVIKGSRSDCHPYDIFTCGFWSTTTPSQWDTAMTVCTWAKDKRMQVVERWLETGSLCRGFNRRFNGWREWPEDDIEEVLEDVLGIVDPLSMIDNIGDHQQFLANLLGVSVLELLD